MAVYGCRYSADISGWPIPALETRPPLPYSKTVSIHVLSSFVGDPSRTFGSRDSRSRCTAVTQTSTQWATIHHLADPHEVSAAMAPPGFTYTTVYIARGVVYHPPGV